MANYRDQKSQYGISILAVAAIGMGLFPIASSASAAKSAAEVSAIVSAAGLSNGLCVYLGGAEGETAVALSAGGSVLVHVLAPTEKAAAEVRDAALGSGLTGVVSAEVPASFAELPYASEMANIIVVDNWAELSRRGLTQEEMVRVLVPGGTLAVRHSEGALAKTSASPELEPVTGPSGWSLAKRSAPAGTDEWTHWDHGADGNALSEDKTVKPPTHLKWSSGDEHWDKMSGPYPGVRIANGTAVYLHPVAKTPYMILSARDAYNGTHKWTRKDVVTFGVGRVGWCPLTLDDKHVFTIKSRSGPAVALDLASGKTVMTYTEASWNEGIDGAVLQLARVGNLLIQFAGKTITAIEVSTGKVVWKHDVGSNRYAMGGVASQEEGKVFYLLTPESKGHTRWPTAHSSDAVIALNLKDGKQAWRNDKVKGYAAGQLNVHRGRVGFFGASGIGGANVKNGAKPCIGMLQASDGKTIWFSHYGDLPFKGTGGKSMEGYHMAQRGDSAYMNQGSKLVIWNAKDGSFKSWEYRGIPAGANQRCAKGVLTTNYIMTGYVTWIDKNFNYELKGLRRSGCAMPGFPAYGMIYFSPATCACIPELDGGRGYVALGSDGSRKIVSDEWRLAPSTGSNWGTPGTTAIRRSLQKAASGRGAAASVIASDWFENRPHNAAGTAMGKTGAGAEEGNLIGGSQVTVMPGSIEMGAWKVEVHASAMYVDIFRNGILKDRLYTGGRITAEPVADADAVYIGAGDGVVYTYSFKDAAPGWKFFAAPYDRRMIVASQLESSWPVTKISLDGGELSLRAGRHPALEKGLFDYGLNATTGALLWKKRVFEAVDGRILEEQLALGKGTELDSDPLLPKNAPLRVHKPTQFYDIGGRKVRVLPRTGFLWKTTKPDPKREAIEAQEIYR